jgi:hypothetical protein
MKSLIIRIATLIIIQELAMVFFMRVVYWGLFLSAGLSAVLATAAVAVICFVQRRRAERKNDI